MTRAGIFAAAAFCVFSLEAAPKKVLVVTATQGFRHSSIPIAENVIATLGETSGAFTVVDFVRGGSDGKDASEVRAKMTMEKLREVDAVIFANTTGELDIPDKDGFIRWVEQGHALIGMHSCSDTFHNYRPFVEMLGGEFLTHGPQVTVDMYNQDPSHPACRPLGPIWTVFDEIYEFKSFDRAKVHGLLTLDKHPIHWAPGDFPVSWAKEVGGSGKIFYTSLGHREDVWTSALYQKHILGGIKWALGLEAGSGKPTELNARLSDEERNQGFRLLFNGTDLTGWKLRNEKGKQTWSAQNGMLVNTLASGEHGTDLLTEEKFRDFIVRYEFQVPPRSNSGFYLRGRHEIQIFDDYEIEEEVKEKDGAVRKDKDGKPVKRKVSGRVSMGGNGSLYSIKPSSFFVSRRPGQWQSVEARMVGNRATVILNGVKIHDEVECNKGTGGHLDDRVNEPGPILLQGDHGAVGFRNVRIKPL